MGREIKFRAWDTKTKKTLSWQVLLDSIDLKKLLSDDHPQASQYYKIMQYTGLKDKNGVEIYEGDIIKLDPRLHPFYPDVTIIGQVFWNNFESEWQHTYYDDRPAKKMFRSCEVIGNIYENPELLENKEK